MEKEVLISISSVVAIIEGLIIVVGSILVKVFFTWMNNRNKEHKAVLETMNSEYKTALETMNAKHTKTLDDISSKITGILTKIVNIDNETTGATRSIVNLKEVDAKEHDIIHRRIDKIDKDVKCQEKIMATHSEKLVLLSSKVLS